MDMFFVDNNMFSSDVLSSGLSSGLWQDTALDSGFFAFPFIEIWDKFAESDRVIDGMFDELTPAFENRKVLLVSESEKDLYVISSLFRRKGVQVSSAKDGCEVFEKLSSEEDVDYLLMDIMMPLG